MTRKSHQNYRSRCNWNYIYLQGAPKKVSSRVLNAMFGDQIIGPKLPQSSPKYPKLAKTVQDNLDGPKWSKNLVSQLCPKNLLFWTHPINCFCRMVTWTTPSTSRTGCPCTTTWRTRSTCSLTRSPPPH